MSNQLPLGMSNPLKDYDVLFKIVLIGDSCNFLFLEPCSNI